MATYNWVSFSDADGVRGMTLAGLALELPNMLDMLQERWASEYMLPWGLSSSLQTLYRVILVVHVDSVFW